jgi:phosphatidylethanolamine-binding protein (PEBP) family uncharacterized protein
MERMPAQREVGKLTVAVEIAGLNREETCEGPGFSPQVEIGGLRSPHLALIMEDLASKEVYWMLWDVPRTEEVPRNLPKEAVVDHPFHAKQGRNLRGGYGYAPPCPEKGKEGRYLLRAYGLEHMLELDPTTTSREDLLRSVEEHAHEYGERELAYSPDHQWSPSAEY